MTQLLQNRRRAVVTLAASSALLLGACGKDDDEGDVGAVEDLMREHGVIRRAVLIFRHAATKLRAAEAIDPQALQRTATLFRNFAEDYHERKLEEENIFPALVKAGGPGAAYVDVLKAQHDRGRAIIDYVLGVTGKGAIATADAEQVAAALSAFELMYQHHAAREDTVVFPAWKATMSKHQLDEMGDKFEDIEKKQFGKDGFDDAVKQIAEIEQSVGLADIAQFTPPAPV